jgi:hypothetical protein
VTSPSRIRTMRMGLHASTSDISDVPGTLVFVEPVGLPLEATGYVKIPLEGGRGDGEPNRRIRGAQKLDFLPDVTVRMRGISGGAGDSTSSARLTKSAVVARFLDALLGAGVDASGETTHASDAGTGTSLIMDAASSIAAGSGVLVKGTTLGKYVAREVVSVSGDTLTLDRALTDDDGDADTPAEGEVVYAAATWRANPAAINHIHMYFDVEGDLTDSRRQLFGCLAGGTIAIPNGGAVELTLSGIRGSSFTAGSNADPTYSAATEGSDIIAIDSPCWIGSTPYHLVNASIDLGITIQPRETQSAAQGVAGYVVSDVMVKITGMIRLGDLDGEAADALLTGMQSTTTYDFAVQVGRAAGSAMYLRLPAADFEAQRAESNGQEMISFTANATRSGNHSNVPGSARLHLF